MELLLVLGIAAGLLLLAVAMALPLAFALKWISPLAPKKPEPAKAEPVEEVDEAVLAGRRAAYRRGLFVFIGLAVLTLVEFGIAAWTGSAIFLFLIALLKVGLILQYYMHLGKVWGGEESHA